jgi:hypothetical protein
VSAWQWTWLLPLALWRGAAVFTSSHENGVSVTA